MVEHNELAVAKGYHSPEYARAFESFGTPRPLQHSGGTVTIRPIDGSDQHDAMGCYPLFCCSDWSRLAKDFQDLRDEIVSLTLVSDPFGAYNERLLRTLFNGCMRPFKTHFVADLSTHPQSFVSAHHRYYGRRAQRTMEIFPAKQPETYLDDWLRLYDGLIARHNISGISAFSAISFALQFRTPGLRLFVARNEKEILGLQIWFEDGLLAYHHLSAYSECGYRLRASYGLLWRALHFWHHAGLRLVTLGASAGLNDQNDGLSRFKAGWSNAQKTVYLCGAIFDKSAYKQLVGGQGATQSSYFPAYRHGEFI